MITPAMLDQLVAMRPFLPAKDYAQSMAFYARLGFNLWPLGDRLCHVQLGERDGLFCFLLQGQYDQAWADNTTMYLLVRDVDAWWAHIESLDLPGAFGVPAPEAPRIEPWGLKVAYLRDPSGVLWHVSQDIGTPDAA